MKSKRQLKREEKKVRRLAAKARKKNMKFYMGNKGGVYENGLRTGFVVGSEAWKFAHGLPDSLSKQECEDLFFGVNSGQT